MTNDGEKKIPRHIAIILDGNGRWAERRGLPRTEGHKEGAKRVKDLLINIENTGVEYLTLYAFSTENWKRSEEEVNALMELLAEFVDAYLPEMLNRKIRLLVTGDLPGMPEKPRKKLENAICKTAEKDDWCFTLVLALNYGGRREIVYAAKNIVEKVLAGEIKKEEITEELFAENLYCPSVPDPDLLIRTSGEMRLSNFLLWELSYTEIVVTDTLWPDFNKESLDKAIKEFGTRKRRFGGRK